jgi:hypothetical protein
VAKKYTVLAGNPGQFVVFCAPEMVQYVARHWVLPVPVIELFEAIQCRSTVKESTLPDFTYVDMLCPKKITRLGISCLEASKTTPMTYPFL